MRVYVCVFVYEYVCFHRIYEHLIPYVTLSVTFLSLCILGYSYYRYVYIFRKLQERAKAKNT